MKIRIHKPKIFDNYSIIAGVTETNYQVFSKGFSIFPGKIYSNYEVEYFRLVLATNLDTKRENLVFQKQEHSDQIQIITNENKNLINISDGMITKIKNIILNVTIADCAGILIYDPSNHVIAALHSGWRGTNLNIVGKGIKIMKEVFNSQPSQLIAWISPSAGKNKYEVGSEVASLFPADYVKQISKTKFLLDLKSIIFKQLIDEGLLSDNIELSLICTIEDKRFHSYRRDKDLSGRMSAFIGMQ